MGLSFDHLFASKWVVEMMNVLRVGMCTLANLLATFFFFILYEIMYSFVIRTIIWDIQEKIWKMHS